MRICDEREETGDVTEEPPPGVRGMRVGWATQRKGRHGGQEGDLESPRGGGDRPSPSLAGRVFRISGMLGMGLLP